VPPAPATIELDPLPVAVVLIALDGTIAELNRAACRFLAQPREALIGGAAADVLGLGATRWQELCVTAGQRGAAEDDLAIRGTTTRIRVAPGELAGQPVLQVVAIERPAPAPAVTADEQRIESLNLVAGGIAHDFNNLLVGVLAEASAAREDPQLGEGAREALRRIEAAAGRMTQLTRQLLAYTGRGRFVTVRLDPDALLRELSGDLTRIAQAPAVLEVTPGAGAVVVEADPSLLRQVVINLVANASDAGGLRISVASRLLSRDNTPWWQLEVTDDGVGIEPAALTRIFDPFFSTRDDRHGLGLSAVHGIVRRFGGDIEVDSTPGQGARFRVRLPIVPGAEPGAEPVAPTRAETTGPIPRLSGLRVLIADDEPSVRATVRRLLERRGAAVVAAADGQEAEDQLRDERFDLAVLDVTMPGRSGYDVLAFARATVPGMPVILMSGYVGRTRGEGGEEEPDAFIEKPFTAKILDGVIDEILRSRRSASDDRD
jgi:two-component system, cell cycle sensor histidine kinase and response regulator CckA